MSGERRKGERRAANRRTLDDRRKSSETSGNVGAFESSSNRGRSDRRKGEDRRVVDRRSDEYLRLLIANPGARLMWAQDELGRILHRCRELKNLIHWSETELWADSQRNQSSRHSQDLVILKMSCNEMSEAILAKLFCKQNAFDQG
jgi:hypothetical protein